MKNGKVIQGKFPKVNAEEIRLRNERAQKVQESDEYQKESAERKVKNLSKEPFGEKLIVKLADKLEIEPLYNHHPYYCGLGLRIFQNEYQLCAVEDGNIDENKYDYSLMHWSSKRDFIEFFSKQSDFTLSRACPSIHYIYSNDYWLWANQTITEERIEDFLKYGNTEKYW